MPRQGLRRLIEAVTVVIVLAMAPAAAAYVPREPSSFFGVSAPNFHALHQTAQGRALLDSYLAHVHETGVGWVRDPVIWPDAEPAAPSGGVHAYRWGQLDDQIGRYARHGLTLQPVIRQTPSWAMSPEAAAVPACDTSRNGMPSASSAADYGAFVGAYLRRYGCAWYGIVDPQSFQLGQTARAYRQVARTYLGYGTEPAPRSAVDTCLG